MSDVIPIGTNERNGDVPSRTLQGRPGQGAVPRALRLGAYGGCAVLLATTALRLFLGEPVALLVFLVSLAAAGLSMSGLVVWLLIRPSLGKLRTLLLPVLAVAATVACWDAASSMSWTLFLWPRERELNSFVRDLSAYGRITEMSDGLRYHKSLNNESFDASDRKFEPSDHPALAKVLRQNRIEPARYRDFRQQLIALGFIDVEVTDAYVALLYDGMLDNLYGVLWVRPGAEPPKRHSVLFGCTLVYLHDRGHGWYLFGTT